MAMVLKITVVAHLISALFYLSFTQEVKLSEPDLFALWFFGSEFALFIPLLLYLSTRVDKSIFFINLEIGHFLIRGMIYALHYSGILYTDNRQRLSFLIGYIFLLTLHYIRFKRC